MFNYLILTVFFFFSASSKDVGISGATKLNKVSQLTGFSDPVYAEAYVHVNQYDIVLDVLIVNQTGVEAH